ncbi:serine/threonine protein phosphatase [Streptomyces sp. NPDC001889]
MRRRDRSSGGSPGGPAHGTTPWHAIDGGGPPPAAPLPAPEPRAGYSPPAGQLPTRWPGRADGPAPGPDTGRVPEPPPRTAWTHEQPELISVAVWTERVPGRGEDAEPLFAHHQESGQGLLAVFDGAGGAGASPVWPAPGGTVMTSAWTGSRVARLATECWFHEVAQGLDEPGPERLHTYLDYFLSHAPQRRSKIAGTMRRQLPTTLAAVHYTTRADRRALELRALWAGDSRAYLLRPERGLQVLTRDHTRESDALELLRSDPPMTNLVGADRPFTVASQLQQGFELPCVLVTATDGWFGYVNTPADFERVLLGTLADARSAREWAARLRTEVTGYTGDDATLVVTALGYRDFDALREDFAGRRRELDERVGHFGTAHGPDTAGRFPAWQDATWQAYRADYEALLPPEPEEGMS